MKKCKEIFLLFVFLFASLCSFAIDKDRTASTQKDTVPVVKSGVDIIAIAGLGMTTGSSYDHWESLFSVGPVVEHD